MVRWYRDDSYVPGNNFGIINIFIYITYYVYFFQSWKKLSAETEIVLDPETDLPIAWINNILLNDGDNVEFFVNSNNDTNSSEITDDKTDGSAFDVNKQINSNGNGLLLMATATNKKTDESAFDINKQNNLNGNGLLLIATVTNEKTDESTSTNNENEQADLYDIIAIQPSLLETVTNDKSDASALDEQTDLNEISEFVSSLVVDTSEEKSKQTHDGNKQINSQSLTPSSSKQMVQANPKLDVFGEVFKWPSLKRDDVATKKKSLHKFPVVSADIWQKDELEKLHQTQKI